MGQWPPPPVWDADFVKRSPLHAPLGAALGALGPPTEWPSAEALSTQLAGRTGGMRFVLDAGTKARRATVRQVSELYDVRIAERGEVATRRESWHDFLNALVWASYPKAKRALSRRQARLHRARLGEAFHRLPSARTPEQDSLSLLDEGGVVLSVDTARVEAALAALEAADNDALGALCGAGEARPWLFGHALHEHLVAGDRDARGGVLVLASEHRLGAVDAALAGQLEDAGAFLARPTTRGVRLAELERWLGPRSADM